MSELPLIRRWTSPPNRSSFTTAPVYTEPGIRRTGSPIERARKAVASRIRFNVNHIARVHPALADHLRRYIRTGTVCTYVVPAQPVYWSV